MMCNAGTDPDASKCGNPGVGAGGEGEVGGRGGGLGEDDVIMMYEGYKTTFPGYAPQG